MPRLIKGWNIGSKRMNIYQELITCRFPKEGQKINLKIWSQWPLDWRAAIFNFHSADRLNRLLDSPLFYLLSIFCLISILAPLFFYYKKTMTHRKSWYYARDPYAKNCATSYCRVKLSSNVRQVLYRCTQWHAIICWVTFVHNLTPKWILHFLTRPLA